MLMLMLMIAITDDDDYQSNECVDSLHEIATYHHQTHLSKWE